MFFDHPPDIGICKKTKGGEPQWFVEISIQSLDIPTARKVAAEVLNACDMAEKLNAELRASTPK